MKSISENQIKDLGITPATCVDWAKESFSIKNKAQLPAKISVHPQGNDFFTSMPCLLPQEFSRFGIKVVHRIVGGIPALGSDILLYDSNTGELLALLGGDWITAMRTGAVATLAIQTLKATDATTYSFIGLGNTARATMLCLLDSQKNTHHTVQLLKYKDQADSFIERFGAYPNVTFSIIDNIENLISNSDVIISCITDASTLICPKNDLFKEGCLVVPIHTRGFQNCDLFFDKVYGDDTDHVKGFRYFSQFKQYAELEDVLSGRTAGRENDHERILSYNIGLGLHDILFASKIYDSLSAQSPEIKIEREVSKFWI